MPRRPLSAAARDVWAATAQVDAFINGKKSRRERPKKMSVRTFAAASEEAREMMRAKDFRGATPKHLVALYALLHAAVYEVEAVDLGPKEQLAAAGMASHLVQKHFAASLPAAAEFVGWCWAREREREQARRKAGVAGGYRLTWRLQFGASLVADYLVERAARRRTGR